MVSAITRVEGGKVVARQAYNLGEAELKNFAEKELELVRFDGYTGYIAIFGLPDVKHGDIVQLKSVKFPERDGSYLVKKVEKSMSVGGGLRQKIYIDLKITV
jgi:phage protein D